MSVAAEVSRQVLSLLLDLLVAGLPRVLFFFCLAVLLAVVSLVWLGRRGAFRRAPRGWNAASKLAYLWVPLVLTICAVAVALISSAHAVVEVRVHEQLSPLVRSNLPTIRTWLTESVDWQPGKAYSLDEAAREILKRLYQEPQSASPLDRLRARAVNYVYLNFGKWVITAGLGALLAYAMGRAGETLGLDKETVSFTIDMIKEMDLSRVDDNFAQVFERALLANLAKVFRALYLKVGLLTAAALGLPALDAAAYFLWYRRRAAPRAAAS